MAPGVALPSARGLLFLAILTLTLVSLTPFADLGDPKLLEVSEGNEALSYLLFLGFALASAVFVWRDDRPALKRLLVPSYLFLAGWIGVTCVISQDPASSMRRAVMLAFVAICGAALFLLPRDREEMARLLSAVALLVIGLSYFGVIFMPDYAIHQATDLGEPQLAGDWRGVFGHKNMSGAVFSVLCFIGFFVKSERPAEGWIIIVLSLVFVAASGGKSSSVICLATIVLSGLSTGVSSFPIWAALLAAPLVALNLLGVGAAAFPQIASVTAALPLDASFTGRMEVWSFAVPKALETPVFGHGFLAFWNSEAMRYGGGEQSTEWAQTAAHAHNGYLDAVLSMGVPGLLAFLAALLVQPALDIRGALARGGDRDLVLMFQRIWMFSLYLSAFETFVFNRGHPSWVLMLFAVFSLRYLSQFPVRRSLGRRENSA